MSTSSIVTILIVEDDAKIRDMLRKFLELNNYSVVVAANGRTGIEMARRIMPDIIISDVTMPEMNGFEFKAELLKEPEYATIPFIFLTSMNDYNNLRKGMELGADDYLSKPVKFNDVTASIETQLRKRKELLKQYAKQLKQEPQKHYSAQEHILVKDKGLPRFLKIEHILCIIADEKYTRVQLQTGEKLILSYSLKEWEEMLPGDLFIRIHRSAVINVTCIEKVEKWFQRGYRVRLKGMSEPLEISRRYYTKMMEVFGGS